MTFLRTIHFICNPDVGTFNPIQVNCIQGIFFTCNLGPMLYFNIKLFGKAKICLWHGLLEMHHWKLSLQRSLAVWPDAGIKCSPNLSQVAQNSWQSSFQSNPKSDQIFGLLLKKNLSPRSVKIAQSGHTGH